jgi:class 3 adenylate cyclase
VRIGLGLKLAIPILLTLGTGFGIYLSFSLPQQTERLRAQAQRRARSVAQVFGANLRSVMLTGDGVLLEGLLADIRGLSEVEELRLFDPNGREVHPAMAPVPLPPADRTRVGAALARAPVAGDSVQDTDGEWRHVSVLDNEPVCRPCHPSGAVRGVLLLVSRSGMSGDESKPAASDGQVLPKQGMATGSAAAPSSALSPIVSRHPPLRGSLPAAALAQAVALGIRQAMLSQRATSVPGLLADLDGAPGLESVQVFGPGGQLRFASRTRARGPVAARAVAAALRTRREAAWEGQDAAGRFQAALTVLPNDQLCHACHPAGDPVRGVVLATTRAPTGESGAAKLANRLLAAALVAGVRNVMISGRGSAVRRYVAQFRELPEVERLHVFDAQAREIYSGARRRSPTPGSVYQTLRAGGERNYIEETQRGRVLVQLEALRNEEKCQKCHGSRRRLRGVIMSTVSLAGIERDIGQSRTQSLVSFALTLISLCVLLIWFVAAAVVRPLRAIGGVAERVGAGDLDVQAEIRSTDEIGLLAAGINQMISGLRTKLHLEKFVPASAVSLIEQRSDQERLVLRGERREMTVLFCDIRGFTTFSEKVEPEEVIRLVNSHLEEQARLIREHNGEVDKFIGDATMAVFDGPSMARDAVFCALAIHAAAAARNLESADEEDAPEDGTHAPGRMIGIGINTGSVVRGTVGSLDRMEYTALGDAVNIAKRLCDAAAPGEVLISAATYQSAADEVIVEAGTPLAVKGRREPVTAYRVTGRKKSPATS